MADQLHPVALVRSRPTYAVDAVGHPASKLMLLVGFGMATMLASMVMAIAVVVVAASAAWVASGSTYVQRHFDDQRDLRTKRERSHQRQHALLSAGVESGGLVELSSLIDAIEHADHGWTSRRFQLEELLDRYVAVAIGHQRCVSAMQATDRSGLIRTLAAAPVLGATEASRCRRELLERRIATWDRTALQATRFEDELAAITDLVRLLAQRSACPDTPLDSELVSWRLAELDAEDQAMLQLAAG